ncbi:MAG TPA: ABC transporter ATP-binding protein [Chloroflexota bacterium]|nr:ABC transporter ATP-binding protein [Chloroflexota bacterium]
MESGAKIRVENATKTFTDGAVVAFQNLSLAVQANEVLCIVGPSGCGKTTLLRCIDGLMPLTSGRIRIDGQEVREPSEQVAVVFQHFGLFPWKTVRENVAYGLRLRRASRAELAAVDEYIRLVGLEGAENRYPYQLSGGMQQRTGLARALAVRPSILLMDEPFASVDAQTREILQAELLRIWWQQRQTMLFITHSIDEAVLLGDRVAILSAHPGRVKEILDVPIERPRDPDAVRALPVFAELRAYIWDQLKQQAEAAERVA